VGAAAVVEVAAAAVAVAGAVKAWDNHLGSVGSASPTFLAEDYRSYLAVLARVHLAKASALRGRVDSSDIVQDALLQAHVARSQFRGATEGEFAAWLRRILTNVLIDAQRRHGRKKRDAALDVSCRETIEETASRLSLLPAGDGTTPSEYVARRERGVLLAAALEALPDDQRTAVELRYLGECTLEEIVSLMDRSRPSVAGLLRRGLEELRRTLGADV
jgi:RNA polymerase sigma-70 factor, ECF subfamily